MGPVAKPIKLDIAFDDPGAIRALVERNGPYPSIASYLPTSATRNTTGDRGPDATLPWFRGNWAINGRSVVEGADIILHNARFAEAAARLFDTSNVVPTTVVVNVNAPMAAGAVHVDIPSFRGANRDRYPLPLLQAMGTCGLFEPWRIVEAGVVSWFYDGPGGAYDYWPDGLDGPMHSQRPPFDNVALAADNDRMYHRIGWVGDPGAPPPRLSASAQIRHAERVGWTITDAGQSPISYSDEEVRISILWKAQVLVETATGESVDPLTPDRVAKVLAADMGARGVETPLPASPLSDEEWIDLVHATYYPPIFVTD